MKSSLSQQILETRTLLEERFKSFEKKLLDGKSTDRFSTAKDTANYEELEQELKKKTEDHLILEKTIQELRQNLLVMGQDHQELLKKFEALKNQPQKAVPSAPLVPAKDPLLEKTIQDLRLKVQALEMEKQDLMNKPEAKASPLPTTLDPAIEILKKKRLKSALFWKKIMRTLRQPAGVAVAAPSQEHENQIKKLTEELDSALERIAELRDELRLDKK